MSKHERSFDLACAPGPPASVDVEFISYAKRLQRVVTWSPPSAEPTPTSSYLVTCTSVSSENTVEVAADGDLQATIGNGEPGSNNPPLKPDESYTCVVVAKSSAGSSPSSTPSAPFVGGDLPTTGVFTVPKELVPERGLYDLGENGQWHTGIYCKDCAADEEGVSEIITSPVSTPPTSVVKLETSCSNKDVVGIRGTFLPSVFSGMLFKDFLDGFNEISYKFYRQILACAGNYPKAAPAFKLTVYSSNAKDKSETSYTQLVWEPYAAPPLDGASPPTDSWETVTIQKSSGSQDGFTSNGGWMSTGDFGQGNKQDNRASLQYWETYLNANRPTFMSDAVVYQVAIELGSSNPGLQTYVNDPSISSGPYSWKFTFTV